MLVAVDVAILLPPDVNELALQLSAALPPAETQGLRLDATHLPHITLAQAFVAEDDIDRTAAAIAAQVQDIGPLPLTVAGSARSSSSIALSIEMSPALQSLHAAVMAALAPFERHGGDAQAFSGLDARDRDITWVANFRRESSFDRFWPHVTLGHAERPPHVAPLTFTATTVGLCHLGRYCSCRRVLRQWAFN